MIRDLSANITNVRPMPGVGENTRPAGPARGGIADSAFRDQLSALQPAPGTPAANGTAGAGALKFSNHAVDRMQMRGIRFSPEEMVKIESAVSRAAAKGAKNSLLLTENAALIVGIKDKTVVTVMDKAALKENVFTNIDSTVIL